MTDAQHEEAEAYMAAHAVKREAELAARVRRWHEDSLRHFGHIDVLAVPLNKPFGLSTCVRCRQERRPIETLTLAPMGCMQNAHGLTWCGCCRECAGRGFRWINTPIPPGLSIYDEAPEGWQPYTRQPCKKCRRRP